MELMQSMERIGMPSQRCDGHEERLLGHSRRVRNHMRGNEIWTAEQDRMYRLEMIGDIRSVMLLLEGQRARKEFVA